MKNLVRNIRFKLSHSIDRSENMKKFYKQATFELNPDPKHPLHKYVIKLDDKVMKTPYRNKLAVPNPILAFLITSEFNRQQKHIKSGEMPILSLCRTAVDADIEGHLAEHLKSTIFEYTKTDTLNFYEDYYQQQYQRIAKPLVMKFGLDFSMKIQPSCSLAPPNFQLSAQFCTWLDSLNNWQLIGLETMTVWLKSTISAYNLTLVKNPEEINIIHAAANIEQLIQMKQNGVVEEKQMLLNQIQLMTSCGQILFSHGKLTQGIQNS